MQQPSCDDVKQMYLVNVQHADALERLDLACYDVAALFNVHSNITVGREPSCTLVMDSDTLPAMLSRNHAEMTLKDGVLFVRDANTVNGTWYAPSHTMTSSSLVECDACKCHMKQNMRCEEVSMCWFGQGLKKKVPL
jgi:hypothetical protein